MDAGAGHASYNCILLWRLKPTERFCMWHVRYAQTGAIYSRDQGSEISGENEHMLIHK